MQQDIPRVQIPWDLSPLGSPDGNQYLVERLLAPVFNLLHLHVQPGHHIDVTIAHCVQFWDPSVRQTGVSSVVVTKMVRAGGLILRAEAKGRGLLSLEKRWLRGT